VAFRLAGSPNRCSVEREFDPGRPQRLGQAGGDHRSAALRGGAGTGTGIARVPVAEPAMRTSQGARPGASAGGGTFIPGRRATARHPSAARAGGGFVRVFEAVFAEGGEFDSEVDHVCCSGWYLFHLHEHKFVMYGSGRTRTCVCKVPCRTTGKAPHRATEAVAARPVGRPAGNRPYLVATGRMRSG